MDIHNLRMMDDLLSIVFMLNIVLSPKFGMWDINYAIKYMPVNELVGISTIVIMMKCLETF